MTKLTDEYKVPDGRKKPNLGDNSGGVRQEDSQLNTGNVEGYANFLFVEENINSGLAKVSPTTKQSFLKSVKDLKNEIMKVYELDEPDATKKVVDLFNARH